MENKSLLNFNVKTFICYILFFVLIYFENIDVLGIKLSIIWKLFFLIYAIFFIFNYNLLNRFLIISFIVSLKLIIHGNFFYGFIEDLSEAVFFLILPVSTSYFLYKYRYEPESLKLLLIRISSFYILTSLPFILDLLESRGGDLEYMGIEGNKLIGIFAAVAISSKVSKQSHKKPGQKIVCQ